MIYNHDVLLVYVSGLFALILTVAIIFIKSYLKREAHRTVLQEKYLVDPETVGDIEEKLINDGFAPPNILEQATIWGIQPLMILCFANMFVLQGEIEVVIAFGLLITTLFHEFYSGEKFSKKTAYQLFVFLLWVASFLIISYRTNVKIEYKNKQQVDLERKS